MPTNTQLSEKRAVKAKTGRVPKLRFPGFSGEWEQKKLGEIIKEYKTRSILEDEYPVLTSSRKGLILQKEYFKEGNRLSERDNKGFNILPKDFMTYRSRSDDGRFYFNQNKTGHVGVISVYYPVFESIDGVNEFLLSLLNQKWKKFYKYSVGTSQKVLSISDFKSAKLMFPSKEEQQKIADFLDTTDKWIENLRAQKAAFESYKKGIMQKIFSQEIRFKDDGGKDFPKWEEKKLGEVGTFLKGKGISKEDIAKDGKNKCIRYGELYTEYNEIINEIKSRTNFSREESLLSKGNDVLVPSSGETALDIATISCVMQNNVLLGGDLNVLRPQKNQSGEFLAYYLSNFKNKDIARMAQGNSVVHLYSSHLKNLKVLIPTLPEQQKIAEFLTLLDKRIDFKKQQIAQAEQFKKGLMQGLFVN